jgi:hypothetical protein
MGSLAKSALLRSLEHQGFIPCTLRTYIQQNYMHTVCILVLKKNPQDHSKQVTTLKFPCKHLHAATTPLKFGLAP